MKFVTYAGSFDSLSTVHVMSSYLYDGSIPKQHLLRTKIHFLN